MVMVDFKDAQLKSAGAYVSMDGLYPFAIGWKLHNGNIPVVRLGGHVIGDETGWECARREVEEEANIRIRPVNPEKTYLVLAETPEIELQETAWDPEENGILKPLLVVAAHPTGSRPSLSLMYMAQSDEMPTPSAEVRGILLLDPESILQLCPAPVTLDQYLQRGGQAVFSGPFDRTRTLEPFLQLRILAQMLKAGIYTIPPAGIPRQ